MDSTKGYVAKLCSLDLKSNFKIKLKIKIFNLNRLITYLLF